MTTEQKRYSLSDSDMLGIRIAVDVAYSLPAFAAIQATWNAILAQEGMSLDDFSDCESDGMPSLARNEYAIPADQWDEIIQWVTKRSFTLYPGDSVSAVNALLDMGNYGPAHYGKLTNN